MVDNVKHLCYGSYRRSLMLAHRIQKPFPHLYLKQSSWTKLDMILIRLKTNFIFCDHLIFFLIVNAKMKILSLLSYSPSSYSKPVRVSFFCWTQKKISWGMLVTKQLTVAIDIYSMAKHTESQWLPSIWGWVNNESVHFWVNYPLRWFSFCHPFAQD